MKKATVHGAAPRLPRCHAEEVCFGDREGGAAVAVVVVEKAVAVLELALK